MYCPSMKYSDVPGDLYLRRHPTSCESSRFHRCNGENHLVNLGWPATFNSETWEKPKLDTSYAFSDANAAIGDNVDYEYYVWDEEYGEYVRTDRAIGERLLSDPRYFQYHYRVVESDTNRQRNFVCRDSDVRDKVEHEDVENTLHGAVSAGKQCLFDEVSHPHADNASTEDLKGRNIQHPNTLEHFDECHECIWNSKSFQKGRRQHGGILCSDHTNCSGSRGPAENTSFKQPNGAARPSLQHDCMSLKQLLTDGVLKLRPLVSCSRPWERPASSREQRVKPREWYTVLNSAGGKSGAFRYPSTSSQPYIRFDKLALQYGTTPTHPSKRLDHTGVKTPLERSKYTRFNGASNVQRGDARKKHSDPVARGCYFRAMWKSDRFLVQQANPSFDIKAYDTWLKNRGHMLRARTLELQKEERRLLMLMQEQELRSGSTWGRK